MTDKEFVKRIELEARRLAIQRRENFRLIKDIRYAMMSLGSCKDANNKATQGARPQLFNAVHIRSFVRGGMYALEILKAERNRRKITGV